MKRYNSLLDYMKDYQTNEACLEYLHDLKWSNGYRCRMCSHSVYVKGREWHYKRCQKCGYDESATAHTLFHKLKFPLAKAFVMVYQLGTMKKGMSTCELSRQHGIHQETAWFFKRKVQLGEKGLLVSNVEVDETTIGGRELGKPDRSAGKKRKVQVALEVEYPEEGERVIVKRGNATIINDYSAEELKPGIDIMVDKDAVITTDGWSAYQKATEGRWHDSILSNQGKNFHALHWHIFNLKNWIRGIHHSISSDHSKAYLDEFYFRFNRRNFSWNNPKTILQNMINLPWMPYQCLVAN